MNKNLILLLLSTLFLVRCNRVTKQEAIGLYVSKNNINTIDTLEILPNGTYVNTMYRKHDSSLIYKNIDNWEIEDGYVKFYRFFSDEDEIHSKEFTAFEDVLITTKLQLERKNGRVVIHHKPMYDDVFLEKIE